MHEFVWGMGIILNRFLSFLFFFLECISYQYRELKK